MPYIGAKVRTQDYTVSLKAFTHSPHSDTIEDIKSHLKMVVENSDQSDTVMLGDTIAKTMEPKMFLDLNVMFYEVEVLSSKGNWYIVSREDELV